MEHTKNLNSDDEGGDIISETSDESIANTDTDADADTTGVVDVSNLSEGDSEMSDSDMFEKGEEQEKEEQKKNATGAKSGSVNVSEYDDDDDDENEEDDDDDDDDDEDDENHLQKFDNELKKKYIASFHPESLSYNNEETESMSHVTRNDAGIIIDPFHKTLPFLTKYEKTRVLGIRTKQLNEGAKPYVDVNPTIIDGYIIAQLELEHKKLPFIIRRPLPNGSSELWRLQDLEIIC